MRILLVEDEAKMARLIERGLREEGHQIDLCERGDHAVEQARAIAYDVIVLDWSLPEIDGLTVLRQWRDKGLNTPVLMLTARGTIGERVTGLRAGADDYLVKPFDFDELIARIDALHRRGGGQVRLRRIGTITIDAQRRAILCGGEEQSLTGREFGVFSELAAHAGEVLTRAELLGTVWGPDFDGEPNIVDVYVGYLRAKLRKLGEHGVSIEAVRGAGFRLGVGSPGREA
jgi:two-component system, OmpR family, response regulator